MIKNNLKKIIEERNINVSQMADSIGISRNSFYGLYKDNQSFKNETWTKIANYLHLTIDDLLYSVSDDVSINFVRDLSTDKFPTNEGIYVGNFMANFYNKYYAIDIDVPISFKLVLDKEYIFVYYDYSNISFLDKPFFDNILNNDNNVTALFNFIYNDYILDLIDFNLPYAFINSVNGSYIDFSVPNRSDNVHLFYSKSSEQGFRMEKDFDKEYISFLGFDCISSALNK